MDAINGNVIGHFLTYITRWSKVARITFAALRRDTLAILAFSTNRDASSARFIFAISIWTRRQSRLKPAAELNKQILALTTTFKHNPFLFENLCFVHRFKFDSVVRASRRNSKTPIVHSLLIRLLFRDNNFNRKPVNNDKITIGFHCDAFRNCVLTLRCVYTHSVRSAPHRQRSGCALHRMWWIITRIINKNK